jgi:hypothetical protein
MKRIIALAILNLFTLTALAQAPRDTLTIDGRFPKSWGAGYSNFVVGASADFWKGIGDKRIAINGRFSVDRQPKDYIGSGITLRGSGGIRVGLPFGQSWAIHPFIGGGISFSQQRNPQYTKTAYAPRFEGGVSALNDTLFIYGIGFLPDSTQNKTRGWGLGFDYYWRLSPRISLHAGGVMTRFKFYQPSGSNIGWYTGGGFTPTFGLTWHLRPERNGVPRQFRKPIPNPPIVKPQPMLQRSQGYVGEFERQFLKGSK